MRQIYDDIGVGYSDLRRPDPRIARAIDDALGDARSVVDVGAGTGSYTPRDRAVIAVEPSLTMIRQRPTGSPPVVQASATHLPFADDTFDAALAVLTIHHWPDPAQGLGALRRVARRRVVVFTWDTTAYDFWLVADYFPRIAEIDRQICPPLSAVEAALGPLTVRPVLIPHDCVDGFLGAYWRRPAAYLDPKVRSAISTFSKIGDVRAGVDRLRRDLDDGTWARRHGHLAEREVCDLGYRVVIAEL